MAFFDRQFSQEGGSNSPLNKMMNTTNKAMEDPRQFARTFNPQDTDDVRKMQGMLGVETDGILGPKTLSALRELQGVSPQAAPEDYSGESEESQFSDMEGFGEDFGDSGFDSFSNNMGITPYSPGTSSFETPEEFIQGMDPNYMNETSLNMSGEMQGPTSQEVQDQFNNQQDIQNAISRQEDPYMSYEDMEIDRYDENGVLMDEDYDSFFDSPNVELGGFNTPYDEAGVLMDENYDSFFDGPGIELGGFNTPGKGPGSANTNRMAMLLRGLNPELDKTYQLDMNSNTPSTRAGVNSFDPRFMQTPKQSRSALRNIINQALNVTTRK